MLISFTRYSIMELLYFINFKLGKYKLIVDDNFRRAMNPEENAEFENFIDKFGLFATMELRHSLSFSMTREHLHSEHFDPKDFQNSFTNPRRPPDFSRVQGLLLDFNQILINSFSFKVLSTDLKSLSESLTRFFLHQRF